MKKQALLIVLLATTSLLKAQLPNPGFENLNQTGTIKNWGRSLLLSGQMDSTGMFHTDSIVFDQDLYFSTPDAHSGLKAMELRNAYFYADGQKITGSARVSQNDSDYSAFSSMIPIPQKPDNFTFYYKFFPVNNDTAFASLSLFDSTGTQVGEANVEIAGTMNSYAQIVMPITYSGTDPAFVSVNFSTAKPGTPANFGTRFLVDDVALTNTVVVTGIQTNGTAINTISCFPNPAEDRLTLRMPDHLTLKNVKIEISDVSGKTVQTKISSENGSLLGLDVSSLARGLYSIHLITNETNYSTKFIK